MQIRIDDLRAFTLVAELRNFNRAAEELSITQPALSRRIKKLEDVIGAKLFERTSHFGSLTTIGESFLPTAIRMVQDFDKSLSNIIDVVQKRTGFVSVAFNMTVASTAMPEILHRFHDTYPNIDVRVSEDSSPPLLEKVSNGEVEFGVINSHAAGQDVVFEPLLKDVFVAVCHRDHPLARKRRVSWKDLGNYPFIAMSPRSGTYHLLERALDETAPMPEGIFQVAHTLSLMGLVGKNLGVSAIPRLASTQRPDLNVVTRPLTDPQVGRTLGIVRRRDRSLSPAAAALLDVTRDVLLELAGKVKV